MAAQFRIEGCPVHVVELAAAAQIEPTADRDFFVAVHGTEPTRRQEVYDAFGRLVAHGQFMPDGSFRGNNRHVWKKLNFCSSKKVLHYGRDLLIQGTKTQLPEPVRSAKMEQGGAVLAATSGGLYYYPSGETYAIQRVIPALPEVVSIDAPPPETIAALPERAANAWLVASVKGVHLLESNLKTPQSCGPIWLETAPIPRAIAAYWSAEGGIVAFAQKKLQSSVV